MIDILIPTYNRKNDLIKNLSILKSQIIRNNFENRVKILISDNFSNDGTEHSVLEFIDANATLNIAYYKQKENIGLEKNTVFILSKAKSNYIMFLGDDDYLPEDYLKFCLNEMSLDNLLGCIIPGNINTDPITKKINYREANFEFKRYTPGFIAMKELAHYGHQMSGILLKRESLLEEYLKISSRNLYLFIFFCLYNTRRYNSVFAPCYKVIINTSNNKDWHYDEVGLLPEVYKSYYPFISQLGEEKTAELIFDFTRKHSYRFGISPWQPATSFKKLNYLLANTSDLKGLKRKLIILFIKDYLHRAFPFLSPYKN